MPPKRKKGPPREKKPVDPKVLWRECFEYYDEDKDGLLDQETVVIAVQSMGVPIKPEEVKEALAEKEQIKITEFVTYMEKWIEKQLPYDDVVEAFKVFDKDGRGIIRTPELRQYMTTIGAKLNDDEIEAMLAKCDPEETGEVHYEEFIKKMIDFLDASHQH